MEVKGKVGDISLRIILVYMTTGNKASDLERNRRIKYEIENKIENHDPEWGLMVLGDFNGHLGFLGYQEEDTNGRMVLDWMTNYSLILLNGDEKCEGTNTWERGNQNSAIDFMLVNNKMYDRFKHLHIDENKEQYDASDHNLMTATFRLNKQKAGVSNKWVTHQYYRTDEDSMCIFRREMESKLNHEEVNTIEEFNKV